MPCTTTGQRPRPTLQPNPPHNPLPCYYISLDIQQSPGAPPPGTFVFYLQIWIYRTVSYLRMACRGRLSTSARTKAFRQRTTGRCAQSAPTNSSSSVGCGTGQNTFPRGEGGRAKRGRKRNGDSRKSAKGLIPRNNQQLCARIPLQSPPAAATASPRGKLLSHHRQLPDK